MEHNTKVLVLTGPPNTGKTTTLKKVREHLLQNEGYICLSHKEFGGRDNHADFFDLLQNKAGKLVCIMSEGDYQYDLRGGGWFVKKDVCDVYVCACTDYFTKDLSFLARLSKTFKKRMSEDAVKQEEMNKNDVMDIVKFMKEEL